MVAEKWWLAVVMVVVVAGRAQDGIGTKSAYIFMQSMKTLCVKNGSVGKSVAARIGEGQLTVSEDECNYL